MKNRNRDAYHFDDDDEIEDGRSVRVPMQVMDSRRVNLSDTVRFDGDEPHFVRAAANFEDSDVSQFRGLWDLDAARDAARAARESWIKQTCDAWRTPQRAAAMRHGDAAEPDASERLLPHDDPAAALQRHLWGPPDDERQRLTEQLAERDRAWNRYRANLANAWKMQPGAASAVENRLERERGRGGVPTPGG
jgi:hypothetical protein